MRSEPRATHDGPRATHDGPRATHDTALAAALERLGAAAANRHGFGRSATSSVSRLGTGMRCSTDEKSWRIDTDLARALGGDASAPSPSTLVRAALGACLAMGYRLRAAQMGVELASVRVTVESESDVRGMLQAGTTVPAGFTALSYHVDIESPAPTSDVERLIEAGDLLSPVLDMLTRQHTIERTVSVTTGEH